MATLIDNRKNDMLATAKEQESLRLRAVRRAADEVAASATGLTPKWKTVLDNYARIQSGGKPR